MDCSSFSSSSVSVRLRCEGAVLMRDMMAVALKLEAGRHTLPVSCGLVEMERGMNHNVESQH
jgi:hypothetical protein